MYATCLRMRDSIIRIGSAAFFFVCRICSSPSIHFSISRLHLTSHNDRRSSFRSSPFPYPRRPRHMPPKLRRVPPRKTRRAELSWPSALGNGLPRNVHWFRSNRSGSTIRARFRHNKWRTRTSLPSTIFSTSTILTRRLARLVRGSFVTASSRGWSPAVIRQKKRSRSHLHPYKIYVLRFALSTMSPRRSRTYAPSIVTAPLSSGAA